MSTRIIWKPVPRVTNIWKNDPLAVPVILSVSPATGPTTGGTAVTLSGYGFTGATSVKFGTAAATSLVVVSDTTITCVTPPGAVGAVTVTVSNSAYSSSATAGLFMYLTALIIGGPWTIGDGSTVN